MNNAVGYKNEQRWGARPTYRISGVYEETKGAGAFMGFHAGELFLLRMNFETRESLGEFVSNTFFKFFKQSD
jgi:hypothetical protein